LFIGTRYGLNVANKRKFHHYYEIDGQNSITNDNVHGFIEDESNNIWIISSGGLDKFNILNGEFDNYPVDRANLNALSAPPISIASDEKNNFWIGTWQGGLFYFNRENNSFTNYRYSDNQNNTISNNSIMSLFHDSNNGIWIGTWGGGLNFYNKNTDEFTSYKNDRNDKNSLSDNEVSAFAEDKSGRIWIGTSEGLNLMADKGNNVFTRFVNNPLDSSSLSNNQINTLVEINNSLWVGTSFGLNRINLDNLSIDKFHLENGLPSDNIKAIVKDNQGNLWVSTNKGLAKIEFESANGFQIRQILSFNASDGLQDEEFLDRSVYKISNGELLFGGTNGFNRFNPENISSDLIAPNCSFSKLLVDNKEIKVGDILFDEKVLNKPFEKSYFKISPVAPAIKTELPEYVISSAIKF
jgi:ligand-binding sensor domain-containing protein